VPETTDALVGLMEVGPVSVAASGLAGETAPEMMVGRVVALGSACSGGGPFWTQPAIPAAANVAAAQCAPLLDIRDKVRDPTKFPGAT